MTLVQQATSMLEKLPTGSQQVVVDLLKMLNSANESTIMPNTHETGFKRTGKSDFSLPVDFDEHFDDMNDEIAARFMGESL